MSLTSLCPNIIKLCFAIKCKNEDKNWKYIDEIVHWKFERYLTEYTANNFWTLLFKTYFAEIVNLRTYTDPFVQNLALSGSWLHVLHSETYLPFSLLIIGHLCCPLTTGAAFCLCWRRQNCRSVGFVQNSGLFNCRREAATVISWQCFPSIPATIWYFVDVNWGYRRSAWQTYIYRCIRRQRSRPSLRPRRLYSTSAGRCCQSPCYCPLGWCDNARLRVSATRQSRTMCVL